MLRITLPKIEVWDETEDKFVATHPAITIDLEHSLVSVSKWESEFEIAFLGKAVKTDHQVEKYVEHMLLTPVDDTSRLRDLPAEIVTQIRDYISKENTATRLPPVPQGEGSRETVTSDLIYYWMIALQIPWEAQNWHLKRLMTLIELTQRKNGASKVNQKDAAAQRKLLNQQRRRGRPG